MKNRSQHSLIIAFLNPWSLSALPNKRTRLLMFEQRSLSVSSSVKHAFWAWKEETAQNILTTSVDILIRRHLAFSSSTHSPCSSFTYHLLCLILLHTNSSLNIVCTMFAMSKWFLLAYAIAVNNKGSQGGSKLVILDMMSQNSCPQSNNYTTLLLLHSLLLWRDAGGMCLWPLSVARLQVGQLLSPHLLKTLVGNVL